MSYLLEKIISPEDIRKLDNQRLEDLAKEIRGFLIKKVSKTGGHLASNLGVVELTLAIHSVYNTPEDKVVWDVGHQAYVHKILTGRKEEFDSLRQYGGLSGFPKRMESVYDVFDVGHSSTSISAALGICRARDLKGERYSVVAVIGDGALTGGMAFEALNDAGAGNNNITVILNDNEMSIAKNVGSLSAYLSKLRTGPAYNRFKRNIENVLNSVPHIGRDLAKTAERMKGSLKYFLVPGMIFEELGFTYLGPVDGHDIRKLKDVFIRSKKIKGPVLIHVITRKGKGYEYAEKNPDKFHGVGSFDKDTGELVGKAGVTYSDVFGEELIKIARENPSVVAITAAMREGTGLGRFAREFPSRFFDVGIAEQHAVTLGAGLAVSGMKPVFAVYSTFLQRAYDQIIHDVCMQKLPLVFAVDRSGVVGDDGETHQGVFDLSYLRHIPNMTIMAPKSVDEFRKMLKLALELDGPVAVRYPRGTDVEGVTYENGEKFLPFKSEVLFSGEDVLIISAGRMTGYGYKAVNKLEKMGIKAGLINARFLKPLDEETLLQEINKYKKIITLEDNVIMGGFGSSILEFLEEHNICDKEVKIRGFPDEYIPQGKISLLFKKYKLDENGIIESVLKMI